MKATGRAFLIYLLGCSAAFGADWQLAGLYFDAGLSKQAEEQYIELAKSPNKWDSAAARYDLGNTYLSDNEWDKAASEYAIVLRMDDLPSLLSFRAWSNLALTRYRQALYTKEDSAKSIFLLQESISAIQEARKSACRLDKEIGLDTCPSGRNLNRLEKAAKAKLAKLLGHPPLNTFKDQQASAKKEEEDADSPRPSLLRIMKLAAQALELHREWQHEQITGGTKVAKENLQKEQEKVIAEAQAFPLKVYNLQVKNFQSAKGTCQNQPWSDALPLFLDGLSAAQEAQNLLASNPPRSIPAMALQERSILFWKNALAEMDKKRTDFKGCYAKGASGAKEDASSKQKSKIQFEQVLQNLQDMDQLDRLPPKETVPRKGVRPW